MTDIAAIAQKQLDAYNAHDIGALLATYAENARHFQHPATLLAAGLKPKPAIAEVAALAPGGRHQAVLEAIKTHAKRHRRLALVGHEPDLGELAARLLGARGSVQFKKGAICAIDVDGATPGGPGTLRWLLTPKALRALAP